MTDSRASVRRFAELPPAVLDCAVYRDGRRVTREGASWTALRQEREQGGFVWVGLLEPGQAELTELAREFGLHPLAVEDAVHAHQRPKVERYGDSVFVVLKTVRYLDHDEVTATSEIVETGEVMVFLGADFVVTVRHGEHSALGGIRRRLESRPELLASGPAAVLYAVADRVVDDYLAVAAAVEDDVEEMEALVFSALGGVEVERVYQLKREVLELRRAVAPLAGQLSVLLTSGGGMTGASPAGGLPAYFRDVEDHLTRVRDQVAGYDDLLTSLLQAALARITVTQNQDMRKISAWVAILAVPTMVAGIYGMNFEHMPELRWRYGYPTVVGLVVLACLLLYRGFKRNRWL